MTVEQERAAVAAWLRKQAKIFDGDVAVSATTVLLVVAHVIERGEHHHA